MRIDRFEQVVRDFPAITSGADLPDPDEIHFLPKDDEVEFRWREQKVCVVVTLDGEGGESPGRA